MMHSPPPRGLLTLCAVAFLTGLVPVSGHAAEEIRPIGRIRLIGPINGQQQPKTLPPPQWPAIIPPAPAKLTATAKDGLSFQSEHFEFHCDARLTAVTVNDFAVLAETTRNRVRALPLAMPPESGRRYQIHLFRDRAGFAAAGGSPNAAGQFLGERFGEPGRLILPFESIGIVPFGGSFSKGKVFDNHLIIHEIGHQLIADYIPLIPGWLNEGLAEYIALPAYTSSGFACSPKDLIAALNQRIAYYQKLTTQTAENSKRPRGLVNSPLPQPATRSNPKHGFAPTVTISLAELFDSATLENAWKSGDILQVHKAYLTSLLLTWYFLHAEGDGQGKRLRLYFENLAQATRYLSSRGSEGAVPDGAFSDNRVDFFKLRSILLERLIANQGALEIQKDLQAKLLAAGISIAIPQ